MDPKANVRPNDVAVIGLAGRLPGSASLDEFWKNLLAGVDMVSHFSKEDLEYSQAVRDAANAGRYVRSRSVLEGADQFDSSFFGIYPAEADVMDPQHRVFLECAWESLESAGYDSESYPGLIGLYAGLGVNSYLLYNLSSQAGFAERFTASYPVGSFETLFGNDKDFMTTRVAYKLNLRGPCVTVQTACSTSLVAIVNAYYSLLTYQCDMALAGGVSITFPQKRDYLYEPDGMVSKDGKCRTFDAEASGTVFGSGVGVVVLKRLADAIADGDCIRAVIRGGAVNNDGAARIGYAAPGVDGQADVIAMAQSLAGIKADAVSYVETHGTGTPLGDPIEVAALTQAFRRTTASKGFCALGTAKTNVGHLEMAAGVTGFIKTILQLERETIAPLLHFRSANPKIDFAGSPFYPVACALDWKRGTQPRIAGVSAFGVGGTNAHVVLEEAPILDASTPSRSCQLLVLSARTKSALETATTNLASHLEQHSDLNLADVAFTLQKGRRGNVFRRTLVCGDKSEAVALLGSGETKQVLTGSIEDGKPGVAFLFPGQGAQYVNMGLELYRDEAIFREAVDRCSEILRPHLGLDLRSVLYPAPGGEAEARVQINQTVLTQPSIFTIEYALAQLWISWGIKPDVMLGHSIGEYVAAVVASVFSLEDALGLLAARARMMQEIAPGSMLAVRLSESDTRALLNEKMAIAAVNGPTQTVVSGPKPELEDLARQLSERKVAARFLETSHAFHSPIMDSIVEPIAACAAKVTHRPPQIAWISSCTGADMTMRDMAAGGYWGRQLREPVRFAAALAQLRQRSVRVLIEVGPGQTLSTLARLKTDRSKGELVLASLQSCEETPVDLRSMLDSLGRLWIAGAKVDWDGFYAREKRRRVPLPTYPFERRRHWVEPATSPQPTPSLISSPHSVSAPQNQRVVLPAEKGNGIMTTTVETAGGCRKDRLCAELNRVISELSGMPESELNPTATFMELGFDSLFLTQASQSLQKKFGIKIGFRQMLDDLSSIGAIATYLDEKLPASAFPAEPKAAPATGAASQRAGAPAGDESTIPGSGSLVERVIAQQMAIMQQQIELLRGGSVAGGEKALLLSGQTLTNKPEKSAGSAPISKTSDHGKDGDLKRFGPFKGIEIGPKGGLTDRQEKSLSDLVARYNRRTAGSKEYAQKHRDHFCDPRAAGNFRLQWKEMVYPIVCARSKGSRIWDIDGNEYIDVTLGFGANFFGHAPEFVTKAVEEQLHKGFEIGPQSPLAGEIAKMLCEMTGMERAAFCNTGSEAVMAAMRVARTVTARDKVVYFAGDYHGIFDEVLARPGLVNGQVGALPAAPGIPPLDDVIVLEYGNPASLDVIRARANEIAAVMVEPVQSRHPDLQPKEFLQALRQLTSESGMALIFDEVVTGFRAALGGAQEYFGVRADLATYGKVIGGGMPIGVVAGSRKFMDALDGGTWRYGDASYPEVGVTFFAGTFVRHPLVMAAMHATLRHLREAGPELQRGVTEKTQGMVKRLNDYFASVEVPIRLQTFSSVFFYDFHPDLKYASLLFYFLRDRGIHIWEGRVGQICTAHTESDIDRIVEAFKEAVTEMRAGGFLPERATGGSGESGAEPSGSPGSNRVPLTEAQREIWIASQMGDDANCSYNESCSLHFRGHLDTEKFRQAIQQVVARHDAFRTRFCPNGDYQEFLAAEDFEMLIRDLSGLSSEQRKQQAEAMVASDMATPFNLVSGPVCRFQLFKHSESEHQFVFTTHHAVCDGWSFGVVFQELALAYSAMVTGEPCRWESPMQFREFAEWSQQQSQTPEYQEAEKFWTQKFAGGEVPALELPYDRPRPALKTYNGTLAVRRCDPQVFRNLKKASGQMGNTAFATLFSAFCVLLHRLSGQDDLVVGIPAAGQTLVGSNDLMGHCLNFLPMRVGVDGSLPFASFASKTKNDILDAFDRQNYTYGTLIQKLKLPRDASRLPLLSAMFNIDKRGFDKLDFAGLQVSVATNPKAFVNFDLFVNLVQGDNELDIECEYNSDLFDRETVLRWLAHFETLMQAISVGSGDAVDALRLLSAGERSALLNDWNQTNRAYAPGQTLSSLFEAQVARTPGAVAALCESHNITYAELNRRANYFAGILQQAGARPNTFVALCVERNFNQLVGILSILKSGAAYVPLDPCYPQERIRFCVEDSQAPLILTQRKYAGLFSSHQGRVLYLDDTLPGGAFPNVQPSATEADVAYVIYTSGSTGKPKGVAIEHRNAVNFVHWSYEAFTDDEMAGVLASTSVCFDLSIFELFGPLSRGGKIILAENALHFPRLAARDQVTLINTVPSAIAELVEAEALPPSVEVVNLAGELLPTPLVERIYASKSVKKVNDLYGPTETTTYSTWTLRKPGQRPTIGQPIANTKIYIVDSRMQPVPVGVIGELLIGGAGVARGYLNRPDLTAQKFIQDPFSENAGARVYRTGDQARFLADGKIEFLGRMDNQVKFRGFRIELGEIETALRSHPMIGEAVVVVREDVPGQKRLVVYVTRKPGESLPEGVALDFSEMLTGHLQPKLPEYMIPSVVVVLDALPRTLNGKVDRKSLPAPTDDGRDSQKEFVAPRNKMEEDLANIWVQILGLEKVSVAENFFELGGDSLLSFRMATRATQAGLPLTPRLVFEHKTISGLVKAIESKNGDGATKIAAPVIARVSREARMRKLTVNN